MTIADAGLNWIEPGYCEYFAAGFTVLVRAAGYPD